LKIWSVWMDSLKHNHRNGNKKKRGRREQEEVQDGEMLPTREEARILR